MMAGDKVMHYAVNIGSSTLMMSDAMDGMPDARPARAYVYVEDVDATCKKAAGAGVWWLRCLNSEFELREPVGTACGCSVPFCAL